MLKSRTIDAEKPPRRCCSELSRTFDRFPTISSKMLVVSRRCAICFADILKRHRARSHDRGSVRRFGRPSVERSAGSGDPRRTRLRIAKELPLYPLCPPKRDFDNPALSKSGKDAQKNRFAFSSRRAAWVVTARQGGTAA